MTLSEAVEWVRINGTGADVWQRPHGPWRAAVFYGEKRVREAEAEGPCEAIVAAVILAMSDTEVTNP